MRIHRMLLENYKGIERKEVRFEAGVTLVQGPNETGKSSFMEAMGVLFREKDSSKKRQIKSLVNTRSGAAPRIEMELETGPYRLTYAKQFMKGHATSLTLHAPRKEALTGDDAHNRMKAILDETLDQDLFEALQVQQLAALEQPELASRPSLTAALDRAAGGASPVEDSSALLAAIEGEFGRYYTSGRGSETGELADARARATRAGERKEGLEAELTELSDAIDTVQRLRTGIERLQGLKSEQERDARDAAEELKALDQLKQRMEGARTDRAEAETTWLRADAAYQERQKRIEDESRQSQTLETLRSSHYEAERAHEELKARHDELTDGVRRAEGQLKAARTQAEQAAAAVKLLECQQAREGLRKRIEAIEVAARAADEAKADLAALTVTDEVMREIDRAHQDREVARASLRNAAPELIVDARVALDVDADGQRLAVGPGESRSVSVTESAHIVIPEIADLRIRPGASLATLQNDEQRAEDVLAALLDRHGSASVAEARAINARRNAAQSSYERAREKRDTLRGEDSLEALREQSARLGAEHGRLEMQLGGHALPTNLDEARSVSDKRQALLDQADGALEQAKQSLVPVHDQWVAAEAALTSGRARVDEAVKAHETALAHLKAAREAVSDESLETARREADGRRDDIAKSADELERSYASAGPEVLEARDENARSVLGRTNGELQELRLELAGVESRVDLASGKGLFENLEEARTEEAAALAVLESVQRRAHAARLLRETFTQHRDAAHRAYVEPFRERIEQLARIVFGPGLEIGLDDDLSIATRVLDGVTVPFDNLSGGAKEQLTLASRLAAAQLVSGDAGIPVILDDTLGHSDPERLKHIGAMLSVAARDLQIIIFSCQPERFQNVGSASRVTL
ncbi:MAG: AAA family ATPase [Gammaproteobacteria bacterium]